MNKVIVSAAAFASLTVAASAADLPRRALPPAPIPVPIFTWTGAYFGINAGYITTTRDTVQTAGVFRRNDGVSVGNRPAALPLPQDGFTGGGQLGYNYQFTPGSGFVVGAEADANYTDLNRTRGGVGQRGGISTYRQAGDFLGTVRGRVGYAFDRVLVYGTGGFAYASVKDRATFQAPQGDPTFFGSRARVDTGYAVGGGIEYALPTDSFVNVFHSNAVTVKAEALYYDLGRSTLLLPAVGRGQGAYVTRFQNEGVLGRVGLNYKFGS
ncbi:MULTISPECIES: outer membrane protein [unclassified Methylobacterium]|uniref:outer membrane protein n=1 Tax=unclassified Methylobacterium TaxID=2615210 RepID=UPI001355D3DA|nr:porin family protein [Methylobacterium sp. 2A]MWV25438.1 porin family protein [Methylobacterium sp. 2A]